MRVRGAGSLPWSPNDDDLGLKNTSLNGPRQRGENTMASAKARSRGTIGANQVGEQPSSCAIIFQHQNILGWVDPPEGRMSIARTLLPYRQIGTIIGTRQAGPAVVVGGGGRHPGACSGAGEQVQAFSAPASGKQQRVDGWRYRSGRHRMHFLSFFFLERANHRSWPLVIATAPPEPARKMTFNATFWVRAGSTIQWLIFSHHERLCWRYIAPARCRSHDHPRFGRRISSFSPFGNLEDINQKALGL